MTTGADFTVHHSLAPILDTVLDAVVVMSTDGEICGWNGVAERVFGWSSHEANGRLLADLIVPEEHRAAHAKGLRRMARGAKPRVLNRRIEITALCRDGSEIPIELSITTASTGKDTVFVGFIRDIAERREAEARLARQTLETRLMFEIANMAAESDSFEGALAKALEAICEITGWPVGHAFVVAPTSPKVLISSGVWHEAEPGMADEIRRITGEIVFGPGIGMPGQILESGEPLWVSDTEAATNFPRKGHGFRGAFGFPLQREGKLIAILEFLSRTAAPPDAGILLTVRALGEQVGHVFERKRTQDQQMLLMRELNHRAKNILAVVQAIAQQTFRRAESLDEAYRAFSGRLMAVARAQDLLISDNLDQATLRQVLLGALRGSGVVEDRVTLSGPEVVLSARNATSVSLGIHELCTNAYKHGALLEDSGHVTITWGNTIVDGQPRFVFEWRESGGPPVVVPTRKGFGSSLLERGLATELGGKVEFEYNPDGLVCRFRVPIAPSEQSATPHGP